MAILAISLPISQKMCLNLQIKLVFQTRNPVENLINVD